MKNLTEPESLVTAQKANSVFNQKKCGQQFEGGDSPCLLHSDETPSEVLHL